MDTTLVYVVVGVVAILGLYIWRILNLLWFKPKKIERLLRDQGLRGSPYKFMFDDLKEMAQMTTQAKSKPMSLTHDIAHRVAPFIHKSIATYGTSSSANRINAVGRTEDPDLTKSPNGSSTGQSGTCILDQEKSPLDDSTPCSTSPISSTPICRQFWKAGVFNEEAASANIHRTSLSSGNDCFTWMGATPVIHISDLKMIREVMANYSKFQKQRGGNPLANLLMKGLIDAEADRWVKHRKIINPAFHVEKLKHMVPAFYASCKEMIEKWEEMVTTGSSCEVDVWPYLQTFTADVISRTSFGSSFEEGRKIFELQREQGGLILKVINSVYIPGSRFWPTKINKRMKETEKEVKVLIKSIIDKRVVAMKDGEAGKDDLLGILLDSNYKEIKQQGNSVFGLSIDEVIDECRLFYFAGQETTRNMLVWTMILLAQNTNWQKNAREEVFRVFGNKTPNIDGLNHLKVMNMIFNEVLRLYPPVTAIRRMVHEDTKLGNLTIPAGTFIQINSLILQHDKNSWGEGANEFKPERFAEGVLKATNGQATYLPFGGGPRICIGQNFAMLEAKMALAMILQRFSFVLSPSYSHGPALIPTLQPQFGPHLILHKL